MNPLALTIFPTNSTQRSWFCKGTQKQDCNQTKMVYNKLTVSIRYW